MSQEVNFLHHKLNGLTQPGAEEVYGHFSRTVCSGEPEYSVLGHAASRGGVRSLLANPDLDSLVSAGFDDIIKIWRVYPFAEGMQFIRIVV